jgi:hypothetical protein
VCCVRLGGRFERDGRRTPRPGAPAKPAAHACPARPVDGGRDACGRKPAHGRGETPLQARDAHAGEVGVARALRLPRRALSLPAPCCHTAIMPCQLLFLADGGDPIAV